MNLSVTPRQKNPILSVAVLETRVFLYKTEVKPLVLEVSGSIPAHGEENVSSFGSGGYLDVPCAG